MYGVHNFSPIILNIQVLVQVYHFIKWEFWKTLSWRTVTCWHEGTTKIASLQLSLFRLYVDRSEKRSIILYYYSHPYRRCPRNTLVIMRAIYFQVSSPPAVYSRPLEYPTQLQIFNYHIVYNVHV